MFTKYIGFKKTVMTNMTSMTCFQKNYIFLTNMTWFWQTWSWQTGSWQTGSWQTGSWTNMTWSWLTWCLHTVFPHIVSAETILFWLWPYVVWPLITVHKCAKTIQGRKLFKGGNYMRKYGILCNVKWSSMGKVAQVHSSTETESSPLHQSSPAN